jgi:hypothetical protein
VLVWFLLWTSLPRVTLVFDLLSTVIIYFSNYYYATGIPTMSQFWSQEAGAFSFTTTAFDVLVLVILRCVIMFVLVSNSYYTTRWAFTAIITAIALPAIYLIIKQALWQGPHQSLFMYALVLGAIELAVHFAVRHKRLGSTGKLRKYSSASLPSASIFGTLGVESYQRIVDSSDTIVSISDSSGLADPDSSFVDILGVTVHYKCRGDGPLTIVFLHGFGSSVFAWQAALDDLASTYRVLAFDRPGFGLTSRNLAGVANGWRDQVC